MVFSVPGTTFAAAAVDLGTAANFAVLAGSGIVDSNPSVIIGDAGSSSTFTNGLTGVEVTGTNYTAASAVVDSAKDDLVTAYDAAALQTPITIPTELGGSTTTPGVYNSASGEFGITGMVTLDAEGDPNAVFIFQAGSTLITASDSEVKLANGAQACNVFWQVTSSATLGTNSIFKGNILALASITDNGGSTVEGRLLARNAAVTLNDTNVTKATCAVPPPPPPPEPVVVNTEGSSRPPTATPVVLAVTPTPVVMPPPPPIAMPPEILGAAIIFTPGLPSTGGHSSYSLLFFLGISFLLLGVIFRGNVRPRFDN